jgi:hypothetical protein
VDDLVPDPTLAELAPVDLPHLVRLLPTADLYLQDEVEVALHPTLTRLWCRRGRRGQRLVAAPGPNRKRSGFGLVDWRDGWLDWALADGRRAAPFGAHLRRAVARSSAPGRTALVLLDNRSIHPPRGSRRLRTLLAAVNADAERLVLVSTPAYDPDANRIEWLWRALRRAVTHNHHRETLEPLLADADHWAAALPAAAGVRDVGGCCGPPAYASTGRQCAGRGEAHDRSPAAAGHTPAAVTLVRRAPSAVTAWATARTWSCGHGRRGGALTTASGPR